MTENEVVHVFGNTKKPKMNTISHLGSCMQFAILNIFIGGTVYASNCKPAISLLVV